MEKNSKKHIPGARWIHIIIPSILVYLVANMDRNNIGFAIAGGMNKTLGMTTSTAGLAAGIFFIGYLFLQVPGGRIADRGNAKKLISITIICWGTIAVLTGFVHNVTELLILRFILGFFEGALWPAVLTIISHWFPNEERGRANGYFLMNSALAAIVVGPISGWILSNYNWRVMFIAEGLLSLVLMFIWLPLMSDRPENAKWLSEEEREYIVSGFKRERETLELKGKKTENLSLGQILKNPMAIKLIIIYFTYSAGVYGFSIWLPTTIKELTHMGMSGVGWLSAIPYIGSILGLYVVSKRSDATGNRRYYTAMPILGFAVCLAFSVMLKSQIWLSYTALIGCGLFIHTASSNFWTIPPLIFGSDNSGGVRGIINALGSLGGFLGPYLVGYLKVAYNTDVSVYSLVLILMVSFVVVLTLPSTKSLNNKKNISL